MGAIEHAGHLQLRGAAVFVRFPKSIYRVVFDTLRDFSTVEFQACHPSQNRAH